MLYQLFTTENSHSFVAVLNEENRAKDIESTEIIIFTVSSKSELSFQID